MSLDRGKELSVVQIDFSTAFYRGSHFCLFLRLRDVGACGVVFDVIAGFISGRVESVVVDGVRSEDVWLDFGVPQGSALSSLLFLRYTSHPATYNL